MTSAETTSPAIDEENPVSGQVETELRDAGLDESDIEHLRIVALELDLRSASVEDIEAIDGFGRMKATHVVRAFEDQHERRMVRKSVSADEAEIESASPDYLDSFDDYDELDPKMWVKTGEHDGVDSGHRFKPRDSVDGGRYWERRKTMELVHHDVDGYMLPDPGQVQTALHYACDFWHRGLGMWIGAGRKMTRTPSRNERRDLIDAGQKLMQRLVEAGNTF